MIQFGKEDIMHFPNHFPITKSIFLKLKARTTNSVK